MDWKSENPEMEAGFWSGVLFLWLQPLFSRAAFLHRRGMALEKEDLTPLPAMDHSKEVEDRFERAYNGYKPKDKKRKNKEIEVDPKKELEDRMIHSLLAVCKQRLITAGIIKFFNTCLQFTFPLLLNAILKYFENYQAGRIADDAPWGQKYRGYWLSALLLLFVSLKALTESSYFHKVNRCSWQIKTAISSAVYRKSLRLASSAQHQTTLGEMVNLMQVDATKMEAFVPQIHVLWDGLLQVTGYMIILGTLLGWPCVIGLLLMMFAGPIMGIIMGKLFGINRAMVEYTDERVKTVNEALQGIRCVKMYTWEESFAQEVAKSRNEELECLRRVAILRGFSRAYMMALPTMAAVVTFLVYTFATDSEISASTLFAAIIAFDQLRFPLMFYPMAVAQYAQAKVSLGRVSIFLGYKEVTEDGYEREEGVGEIVIENTTIFWSDPESPMTKAEMDDKGLDKSEHTRSDYSKVSEDDLIYPKAIVSEVNLHIAPKELCAVVGRVGSGKSTLCSAILNETVLSRGSKIKLTGKVAYVAQSAWIMNRTVRDNILFGLQYDEERYNKVVDVCQLTHDLEMLDDGDMTEIGEKGINLSGGQKQRVSVARAAYANADVIIFDDPLSALDPEVAMKLFDECIVGFLGNTTRLLVTNQLQCLPKCDSVVALGKGGRVVEQGTYADLMKVDNGEVRRLLKDLEEAAKKQAEDSELNDEEKMALTQYEAPKQKVVAKLASNVDAKEHDGKPASLVTQEEREIGAVKLEVYVKYIRSAGGFVRFAFVIFFFILSAAVNLATGVWIALWTSDTSYERNGEGFYIGGYALFAVLVGVFSFCRSYLLAKFGVQASSTLHKSLLASILRAPMHFFDTTPTGRILSRFSKDMHTVDQELADFLDFVIFMGLSLVVTMGTIVFATPWIGIVFIPLGYVYVKILNYFRDVSRETKRLESLSRSPVYAHFSETLGGLSTIRAYGESASFVNDFENKLDGSTKAIYSNKTSERWLSTRLELVGAAIAGLAAVFSTQVVLSNGTSGIGESDSFASLAGLSLTYAIQVTGMLQWVVRSFAQVEAAMNSAERVLYYTENIPKEAAMDSNELQTDAELEPLMNSATKAVVATGGKSVHPTKEWPESGAINLNNLRMRYRTETPLVLKGLNVTIAGGERVGVVGRTGSGKSSLLLCLMRIVEPELASSNTGENYEAPLMIDGVDVLRIGLADLRTKLGIIPQNPVLFSGTIRSNMDPFNEYTDDAIWDALAKCSMRQAVLDMPDELLGPVAEYGENLSQGQRQLLCLGRALLKKCRILLLDEATSSVDYETDQEIQRTIREAFVGCTVLTIAHRVNTIMDSDKILVMKDGVAAEFAPPKELLNNESSLFSEIVRHSQAENEQ